MIRIACIDNLSALAYRMTPPDFPAMITADTPTEVARKASASECDAALLPVACLDTVRTHMRPLGNYGIAVRGRVQSVVVLSHAPIYRVIRANQPIAVTGASQTSRRLLRILCWRGYGRETRYVDEHVHAPARLLIGNEAIRAASAHVWPVVTDLGLWWFNQTGLPFVFARWVVREDCSASECDTLLQWLESCAQQAESVAGCAAMTESLQETSLRRDDAHSYYQQLRVRLGAGELAGLETFHRLNREMLSCTCNV